MKLNIKYIVASVIFTAAGMSAAAQNTRSGYFVDEYTYRFQMNPAMGNERNFVAMPGLGNLNAATHGNMGVRDILYNVDGRTCLYLNPGVSASEVLGNLHNMNKIGEDLKVAILAGGFKAWGGYNTVVINARSTANVHVPKSVFSLTKQGVENAYYDITGLKAHANAYAEISLGHSRNIGEDWRVGANLKILVGAGNAEARLNRAILNLQPTGWEIEAEGEINANVKGLEYETKVNKHTGHEYVNDVKVDNGGINGLGFAADLGVVFSPKNQPWEFSASLLDLGFINWKNNMLASTNGVQKIYTDRYNFSVDSDSPNSFKHEWENLRDDLTSLYELNDMGDTGSCTKMLGATVNVGVGYTIPGCEMLKLGLLNSTRIQGDYTWTDFRGSVNITPCDVISGGANLAVGTYGVSFGWMANLHVTGFNFFLGMDHTFGSLSKDGIPLYPNNQLNLGMNFLF